MALLEIASDPTYRTMTTGLRSFEIPYGSLVPLKIDGLLAAGRIISQTHDADMWTRGIYCCVLTGQCAGAAAALAARDGVGRGASRCPSCSASSTARGWIWARAPPPSPGHAGSARSTSPLRTTGLESPYGNPHSGGSDSFPAVNSCSGPGPVTPVRVP